MKLTQKIFIILLFCYSAQAQHRGDDLAFQGFGQELAGGVKAAALGNAYTAANNDLDALYYNPAGISLLSNLHISFAGQSYQNLWRENQAYRSNRQVTTMSLILDGLITPNPANNGIWDHDAYKNDSTYAAIDPVIGEDAYSEAAADWQKKRNKTLLHNIAIAYPIELMDRNFVLSAAYHNSYPVNDFDRNATYLDPHPGSNIYNEIIPRVVGPEDSVRINWYDYARQRFGDIYNFRFTLASNITEEFSAGLSFNYMDGETEELQSLNKVGWFDLLQTANNFIFSYDTLDVLTQGKSTFNAFSIQGGLQLHLENISVGLTLNLPYTLKRDWNLTTSTSTIDSSSSSITSGTDEMDIPLSFALGIMLQPVQQFRLYLDYKLNNFTDATFSFDANNATHRGWKEQQIYGIGVEYLAAEFLSLMIGYQNVPQTFAADGAAVQERGPSMQAYSAGASVSIPFGRVNMVYQFSELKYEDIYYSNTNFNYQSTSRFLFGYDFKL